MNESRPPPAEGDVNISPARAEWRASLSDAARAALDEDERYFLRQSLSTPCLAPIVRAEGAVLTDVDGRRIFDFHGNSVHQLGHGHPKVVAAIRREMESLPFCPRRFANATATALARRLVETAPNGLDKVLFAPSGAAAISMALKLARYAAGRHKTLSLWDSFHGANLDAIGVGGEALFRGGLGPMIPGAEHLPPLNLARRFFGDDKPFERYADYIDYVLEVQGDVSALIAEPVRWTVVEAPPTQFWPRVKDSCRRHGALLIFDEIPSCLARTGTLYACEQFGTTPDILVIGKGLGGGIMPLAAILAPGRLDCAPDAALGHYTHEKSPVACAAGLATLDVIEEEKLIDRAKELGRRGLERLHAMQARYPVIRDARGLGCYFGVEIGGDDPAGLAERLMYRCLKRGLSFKIGGGGGVVERVAKEKTNPQADVLVTLPPFIQRAEATGLLQPFKPTAASAIDGGDDSYQPLVNNFQNFIYNAAELKDPPKSFDDLLDPKFKGKIQYSTPGQAGDGTAVMLQVIHAFGSKDAAFDYLKKLQDNNVGPSASTGKLTALVNKGELYVANGDLQMNMSQMTDNPNIKVFWPAGPNGERSAMPLPYYIGLVAGAPDADNGKKLIEFLLSKEAQGTVSSVALGMPVRKDVTPTDANFTRLHDSMQGVTVWTPDWAQVLKDLPADVGRWRQATGS